MTEQMRETADIIGRDDVNDLEAILSVVNTDTDEERHGVHSVYDTIFTWDYARVSDPSSRSSTRRPRRPSGTARPTSPGRPRSTRSSSWWPMPWPTAASPMAST